MIFEMTQDYSVIVPLMIANLISLFVASQLQEEPIYEGLAIQDGIHLPTAETRQRYGQRQVFTVMKTASESLPAETPVREALEKVRSSGTRSWLVSDQRGVVGVVNLSTLEKEQPENGDKTLSEIVDPMHFPHVHSDHGLDLALERMGTSQVEILPVVNRGNVHKVEGIVTLQDLLNAYGVNRA
jgi:CIC family chloride channel protein